ncbi:MAG: enoyl-CoA hydratase/isomerase family protein [Actinomycetota bacterium]
MEETVSETGKLIVQKDGPVTRIVLNRPEVHNALDRELSQELHDAFRDVSFDRECRVMVLSGAGDTFCAGDDVKEFNTWKPQDGHWQIRLYQETVTTLEKLDAVTIAKVDGVCTGGGLELTLASDFVVATDRSRWGMPEINWDITPGWGGTAKIAKYAGRRKAKEWNLLGTLFSAAKAERYDLVNRLVTPEQLDAEVDHLVEILLSKGTEALRRTKYYLDQGADLNYGQTMAFEGVPREAPSWEGIRDFVGTDSRNERRKLLDGFWFD